MTVMICTSPLCGREANHFNLGTFCAKHWQQVRKFGRLTPEREQDYHSVHCLFRDCGRQAHVRNLCHAHYGQVRDDLPLTPLRPPGKLQCGIHACDRLVRTKGLCATHHKKYGTGIAFRPLWFGKTKRCVDPGCTRDVYSKGLCSLHYEQSRNFVSVTRSDVPCILCGMWHRWVPRTSRCYDHRALTE